MKFFYILFFSFLSSGCIINVSWGQNIHSPVNEVFNALKEDRIQDIVKYFDHSLPININNIQSIYSSNQAEIVLKDFFQKNEPHDWLVAGTGSPNNNTKYLICTFTGKTGKYGVYIMFKLKDNVYLLQEIRIYKE